MIVGQYLCECVECGNQSWELDADIFECPKCHASGINTRDILDYAEVLIKEDAQYEIDVANAKY